MKTPLEELFNSMSSLQKELNQENKKNIKQRNLQKIENYLKTKRNNQK